MFHLHHLIFLPFFVLFHVVGFLFLAFAALILTKAFRRRRCGVASRMKDPPEAKMPARSGNEAFDDYRRATLRKLEAEADEFRKYLDRLRRAADAAAFEAFLKSRRAENGPAA